MGRGELLRLMGLLLVHLMGLDLVYALNLPNLVLRGLGANVMEHRLSTGDCLLSSGDGHRPMKKRARGCGGERRPEGPRGSRVCR